MENVLKTYYKNRPLFLAFIRAKEAELYQKYLPLKKPILDVGCGDGFFAATVFLPNTGTIEVGLDIENSRIKEAKQGRAYQKLIVYDGKKFPIGDEQFASVISNCVFEHLPDLDATLREIHRVLKPGGKVFITVMSDNWEKYLWGGKILGSLYLKWFRKKQEHLNLLNVRDWEKVFIRVGFKVENAQGYIGKEGAILAEVTHYTSLPDLLSYLLFKKWVLFRVAPFVLTQFLYKNVFNRKVTLKEGSAIFFVLWKK